MKKRNSKILAFVLLLFVCIASLSAQEAINKAVTSINQHILLKEYDKAYSYALFIVRFYRTNPMPLEALVAVEQAVTEQAASLAMGQQWSSLIEMEKALEQAPATVKAKAAPHISEAKAAQAKAEAERIAREKEQARIQEESKKAEAEKLRLAQIEAAIKAEKAAEEAKEAARLRDREEAIARENALLSERSRAEAAQRAQIDKIIEENRKLELEKEKMREAERTASLVRQQELERNREESEAQYRQELSRILETVNKSNTETIKNVTSGNYTVILGLGIVSLLVIFGITILVIVSLRQQKLQHEQFKSTLQTMQAMRSAQPAYDLVALPFAQQDIGGTRALIGGRQALMIEGSTTTEGQSPDPSGAGNLKAVLAACQSYGQEIDKTTGRKNASRLVADIVYKLSRQLGYSEQDSILYFAVGLVYDIGFLNIDPAILRAEHISEDQFEIVKTHPSIGLNMVFFVDEQYRPVFKDGVSKHHENLDGSGYPQGLKGKDIPYIARALRVAESYIALISSREYRQIKDRNAAINELRENSGYYDQEIVEALDMIV